jgi:hypothetical protein
MSNYPTSDELKTVIKLQTTKQGERSAKQITSLSADTIKREFPEYVVKLSERRVGITLGNALKIAAGQPRAAREAETKSEI